MKRSSVAVPSMLLAVLLVPVPLHAICAPSPCVAPLQNTAIEIRQRVPPQVEGTPAFDMQMVLVRVDPALDMWSKTQAIGNPPVSAVTSACPFDLFMPLVTLTGMTAGADGEAHATIDISWTNANGVTEVMAKDLAAWDGNPLPPGLVALSDARVGLGFDDKEPFGTLTILVDAHDKVSGETVHREAKFELAPWRYGETPKDEAALENWFTFYYRDPHPAEAVRAYLELAPINNENSMSLNAATMSFFRAIFAENPWLTDHLVAQVTADVSPEVLVKVIIMLHLLDQEQRIDELPITTVQREAAHSMVGQLAFADPYATIVGTDQLDTLWGEFLATGRYAPFRQIVTAFRLAAFKEAPEAYKESAKTLEDLENAQKGVAFGAAVWSIDSNLGQHPLLVQYGIWMMTHEKLTDEESAGLGVLLARHAPELVRVRSKGDPDTWPAVESPR